MKFNRIKYKNYRCFLDLEISFDTTISRNISMIVAPNGGGKTEMLFSFWWVLYDFKFDTLKGKGYTAYALNSTLYQDLDTMKSGKQSCSVELDFEDDDYRYNIKRTEYYVKNSVISKSQDVCLVRIDKKKGTKLLPIKDPANVERIISHVLPQNILGGIIFDGERMKQLSQIDDDARKAVEGVIKQITNEELFERCRLEFDDLHKDITKKIKDIGKNVGKFDIEEIAEKIQKLEKANKVNGIKLQSKKGSLDRFNDEYKTKKQELSQIQEVRDLENKREELDKQLGKLQKSLTKKIDDFKDELNQGSLLATNKLVADVRELLDKKDIPAGLTADAVRSILLRDTCICGCDMTSHMKDILNSLVQSLPPDNINSTIQEIANSIENGANKANGSLKRTHDEILELENEINDIKGQISELSKQITEDGPAKAKQLEKECNDLNKKISEFEIAINELDSEIGDNNLLLKDLHKDLEAAGKHSKSLSALNDRDKFVQKCIEAIKLIHEHNKMESLKVINANLNVAYEKLSEDWGRKLYIVQYDEKRKYRLLSYFEEKLKKQLSVIANTTNVNKANSKYMTEDILREKAIIQIAENSSTGQSKINSLAFAKSILDYSSAKRSAESTELTRNYPFLIDSPFTELSNENLSKSSEHIHSFSHQIILMISEESLSGVRSRLAPYIGSISTLAKNDRESFSYKI